MNAKRTLITGITGQDGSYLAELLLEKGYAVIGVTSGKTARANLALIEDKIEWVVGDITDEAFVRGLIEKHRLDEVYNLASVATVAEPWKDVPDLARVVALTPMYFLEAIRTSSPHTRFFQASSSEMYGAPLQSPQNEATPFSPHNPYGIAKTFAHRMLAGYREYRGLYATSGILFTHESPRRPETFVSRKITSTLARIKLGSREVLQLGNLNAQRDWGFAGDYVEAMWLMLQKEEPEDYIVATGKTHTVREFVREAVRALDMTVVFEGSGLEEVGKDANGKIILKINPTFYRPVAAHPVCGDSSKAQAKLSWQSHVPFAELVTMMVKADLGRIHTNTIPSQ